MRVTGSITRAVAGALLVVVLPAAGAAQTPTEASPRRLTLDETVRLSLEHNLGIRIARIDPLVQDLGVAQVRASWTPLFTSTITSSNRESPTNSFLSGGIGPSISDDQFTATAGVQQSVPRGGGRYTFGWDASRSTTTNLFSNFNPQVRS